MTNDYPVYIGASATITLAQIASKEDPIRAIQIQLPFWKLAKAVYSGEYLPDLPMDDIGRLVLVIDLCCNSLSALAGVNVPPSKPQPYLLDLYKDWGLESEHPKLFKKLCEMNKFHTKVSKHFAKDRAPMAILLNRNVIREFMKATQDIWRWALNKIFKCKQSANQLEEFKEEFD